MLRFPDSRLIRNGSALGGVSVDVSRTGTGLLRSCFHVGKSHRVAIPTVEFEILHFVRGKDEVSG